MAEVLIRRHYPWVAVVVLLALLANEIALFGGDLPRWDWLLVSGTVLFLAVYPTSLTLPRRLHDALRRLVAGRALRHASESPDDPPAAVDLPALAAGLHARARRAALVSGPVAAGLLLAGWLWAKQASVPAYLPVIMPQAAGACLVGMFVGRAISYGWLGRHLAQAGLDVRAQPGHLDGAAGLRPVGNLFLFHATLIAVVGVYMGLWWLAIPHVGRYADWHRPYAGLVVVVVTWEVMAFLLPLWWFHRHMAAQKRDMLARADVHGREVVELQSRWLAAVDDDERSSLDARIAHLSKRYHDIEGMPVWPLDTRVRRRFAANNLAVFLPLVVKLTGAPEPLQDLGTTIGDVLGSAA